MKRLFASIFIVLVLLFGAVNPSYSIVSSENPRVSYVGNGVIDDFAFTYKVFQTSDLLVYVDDVLQTLNVHYTVVLNTGGLGGTVTFGASYIPGVAAVVDIVRSIPLTQSMNLYEGQRLPAETLESTLDKQTMTLQDMNSKLSLLLAGGGITPIDVNTILAMLGYEDARVHGTLEAANTAAYNAGKFLLICSNWTLTANTTLTASVIRIPGGSFTKASTYTLTFSGKFVNPDNGQAFIGFDAGDVTFGAGAVKEVYSEWWGQNAIPGTTDMSGELDSADASISTGIIIFQGQTYLIGDITINNNIKGKGRGKSILKAKAGTTTIITLGSSNILIEDVDFQGNDIATRCIYGANINNITLNRIYAEKATSHFVRFEATTADTEFSNIKILNSEFGSKSGAGIVPSIQIDGAWGSWPTGARWSRVQIDKVISYDNDGIYLNAIHDSVVSNSDIRDSTDININCEYCSEIKYIGNHVEGSASPSHGLGFHQYVDNSIIQGNTIDDCDSGIYLGAGCDNNTIIGNVIRGTSASTTSYGALCTSAGANHFIGNEFIMTNAGDVTSFSLQNATKASFKNNTIWGKTGQQVLVLNDCTECSIIGNTIHSGVNGIFIYGSAGVKSKDNFISGNHFLDQSGTSIVEADTNCFNNVYSGNFFKDVGVSLQTHAVSAPYKRGNVGVIGLKAVTSPAVPASTVGYTNEFGVDCMVYIAGGTVTVIAIAGVTTGFTSGSFLVPNDQTIAITYTVVPTWVWISKD